MANPIGRQLTIALSAIFGVASGTYRELLNYTEPASSTAGQVTVTTRKVVIGSANFPIDLSSILPSITSGALITLKDVTGSPGAQLSFSPNNAAGTKLVLAAGGAMALRTAGTLPILYFDNASGVDAFIEIGVAGT